MLPPLRKVSLKAGDKDSVAIDRASATASARSRWPNGTRSSASASFKAGQTVVVYTPAKAVKRRRQTLAQGQHARPAGCAAAAHRSGSLAVAALNDRQHLKADGRSLTGRLRSREAAQAKLASANLQFTSEPRKVSTHFGRRLR